MKNILLIAFFAIITAPCTLAMEKETQQIVPTQDLFAQLPSEMHKEIIIKMLSGTPSAIENLKTLQKLMLTSKQKTSLKNLFANQKNVIEFCFALKNSTENIFRSLYLLRVYNFITEEQYQKLYEQFKKEYPDEFKAHQEDERDFRSKFVQLLIGDLSTPADFDKLVNLLNKGINVNKPDLMDTTLLMRAALNAHVKALKLLLMVPYIDVNAKNPYGETALILAAKRGFTEHLEIVKLLLTAPGIDVNITNNVGDSALILAARNGKDAVVKLLLAVPDIDVNSKDKNGSTALIEAATFGHDTVVKLLLAAPGIDVNSQDSRGFTALIWATYMRNIKMVELLLATPGIDVNIKNKDGKTALDLAKTEQIKKMLQDFINQKDVSQTQDTYLDVQEWIKKNVPYWRSK